MGAVDDADPGLPLKLWPCSNGEYLPPSLDDLRREAMRRARRAADEHARRHAWSRRRFLLSSAGLASGLAVLQACSDEQARSRGTEPGGRFSVPESAATDPEQATTVVHGSAPAQPTAAPVTEPGTTAPTPPPAPDLVVDVQTHFLESGPWGVDFPQGQCGEAEPIDCLGAEYWRDLVFTESDTAFAIISAVPVVGDADPLSIEAMARGRELARELCGDDRVMIQGHAVPDVGPLDVALAAMADVAAEHDLCAWKVYTHASGGWYLDDHDPNAPQIGQAFVQAARDTGVPIVAVHKGLSGGNPYASPVDIGPAAAANPDVTFLVYHSGYEAGTPEAAYDPAAAPDELMGVDRLIRSMADAGLGPGANAYAELGSTWRTVMGNPDEAAHVLGKLLVAFGPDRILWGTDSIWYGSPQDQIAAFRAFEITPAFQEQFGYPALTPAVKQRILAGNAVDLFGITLPATPCRPVSALRTTNHTYGPRTRRDVLTTFVREHPWVRR